jgi:hypothetical protein
MTQNPIAYRECSALKASFADCLRFDQRKALGPFLAIVNYPHGTRAAKCKHASA